MAGKRELKARKQSKSASFDRAQDMPFDRAQDMPSPFVKLVASVIRAIPYGTTLSYAGVALRANRPGGARQVVRALRELENVPWWRVIRSDGTMAPVMVSKQAPRLRREGHKVVGSRVK